MGSHWLKRTNTRQNLQQNWVSLDTSELHKDTYRQGIATESTPMTSCNKNGLVFNAAKFKIARREVEFAGFLITETGIKPAAKYTESNCDYNDEF